MLTYSFSDLGSDTLYEHLYKCIKNDIIQGLLAPGERLPSKRAFAKNLNISTITIETAYAQLISEGYLYSIPKKGYFVADLSNIPSECPAPILYPEAPSIKPIYFADFVNAQTNPDNFPFSIWAKLMREVISEKKTSLMTNSPAGGSMELREAIAMHLKQFRNLTVSPKQIIIGAGTEYLYGLLIQLLGHNKTYAVEDPGYQKIAKVYKSNEVPYVYLPITKDGIDMESLHASTADIVHISPSHHYPTGIVTPISKRYELLGWASKSEHRYIIEDDYDSEFRLMGKPIPSLQSIDVMEKVIYINTFTKSLSSTIRISYMVLPNHLLETFYQKLGFYSCTVSNFEQYTLAMFIKDGYFEKHINRMRNYYRRQRDLLLEEIKKSALSPYAQITEEDAGLHFLLHLSTSLSDELIEKQAVQHGIHVSCLSKYYHNPSNSPEHILVMNYAGVTADNIKEALHRLYKSIR